ncbi:hypothetical protein L6R29_14635 [Myxococcota bacterium]|nr:hypothetical protein [Myxococcota bacterium]
MKPTQHITSYTASSRLAPLSNVRWFGSLIAFLFVVSTWSACQVPTSTEATTEKTTDASPESAKEPQPTEVSEPSTEPSSPESAQEPSPPDTTPSESISDASEPISDTTPSESTSDAIPDAQEPLLPDHNEPLADQQNHELSSDTPSEHSSEPSPDTPSEHSSELSPETLSEPSPEQATKTFVLEGIVADFFAPGNPTLGGVKVCLYQRPSTPCVLSAQDGSYVLSGVPYDTEIAVTFEDSVRDLVPMMFPFYVDSKTFSRGIPRIRAEMFTKTTATQIAALLGVNTLDWTKAQVGAEIQELDPFLKPVVGGTVVMTPASGTGPIYIPDPGQSSATSTQSTGLAVFFNVAPNKDYDFVYSHPQRRCYPDDRTRRTATTSRITTLAGWFVVTSWLCDPLPPTP